MAPVALPLGIAIFPGNTIRYSRHCRKAVFSVHSPSLVLVGFGSTPTSSSARFRPVVQLQPTSFIWYRPTTPPSKSLFPYNQRFSAAVIAYARLVIGCRGFRPTASAPCRACISTERCSGGSTVIYFSRHRLIKCSLVLRISHWGLRLALRLVYMALSLQNSYVVLSYDFVLLAPVPLPC